MTDHASFEHMSFERSAAALRDLDPATAILDDEQRRRADETLARILATPDQDAVPTAPARPRRRGYRFLVPVGLLTALAVAVPAALGGGSAFASWTATPTPLSTSAADAAATTCRAAFDLEGRTSPVVIGERRGGWTYVLLEGRGEAACLVPNDVVGQTDAVPGGTGFFGSYDPEPPEAPTPRRDGIVETESMGGAISVRDRIPFLTTDEWVGWVRGYAGSSVTGVTVHPPVGPAVEASLVDGRFSAWWPAGPARGDNPGVGGAWTYTLTLADGTTREVQP